MAKPRIFVSSTYYDLRYMREGIEKFIEGMGYEPVLFESGDIPFSHETPLDESCYKAVASTHIVVLIIGGRFGSPTSDSNVELAEDELEKHYQHYNSVTQKELQSAFDKDIPIYIFVDRGVSGEYKTYKENKGNKTTKYAHVDSVNVFRLLDSIYSRKRNNLCKEFDNIDDIIDWLRVQWAGKFEEFLAKSAEQKTLKSLQNQLNNLENITDSLKSYSEDIIRGVNPDGAEEIIKDEIDKLQEKKILSSLDKLTWEKSNEIIELFDDDDDVKEEIEQYLLTANESFIYSAPHAGSLRKSLKDIFLSKLKSGVKITCNIIDPESEVVRSMAQEFGLPYEDYLSLCRSGYLALKNLEAGAGESADNLKIILSNEQLEARYALVDYEQEHGVMIVTPLPSIQNSNTVYSYLVSTKGDVGKSLTEICLKGLERGHLKS